MASISLLSYLGIRTPHWAFLTHLLTGKWDGLWKNILGFLLMSIYISGNHIQISHIGYTLASFSVPSFVLRVCCYM